VSNQTINRRYCVNKIRVDYPHVGLYEVDTSETWIARKRVFGIDPIRISHARLLTSGGQDVSTADKDRYVCYWFHLPGTGSGHVHGYPIEWDEGHLLIRLDPNWNYLTRTFIPNTDTHHIEKNIDIQYEWGERVFRRYIAANPGCPLSWHMIGPRASDSMFYIERVEGQ